MVQLPYKSYCIEGFNPQYKNVYKFTIPKNDDVIRGVFTLKAEIKSDTYGVYCENNNIGNAYVPSYKLSVYLNNQFRHIKENDDLDMLEESDSEDDFEDVRLDKYVDITKEIPFSCIYNKKFRAWIPEKVLTNDTTISYTQYKAIKYL